MFTPSWLTPSVMLLVENHINVVTDEELENDSREVFKEEEERVSREVEELRDWILSTEHMKNVRHDQLFLRLFLRGCNYSVPEAKDKLDLYFTVRSVLPCWFDGWDPTLPQLEAVLRAGVYLPLQGYDRRGRYCFLIRLGRLVPCTMSAEDCYKVFIMIFNLILEGNKQSQTKGMCMIIDMEGMTASHATMVSPTILKKLVVVFQEAYPMDNETLVDLSSMYFLNMTRIVEKFFSLFVSFLNKRYKKMITVVQDKDSTVMVDEMGEEILPAEYGGTNRTSEELTEFWVEEMARQSDWLARQCQYKTDETLRRGKSKLSGLLSCAIM